MRRGLSAWIYAASTGLCLLFTGAIADLGAQDVVAGGEAVLLPSVTLSPLLVDPIQPRLRTEFRPIVRVSGELIELSASARIWHEIPDPDSPVLESGGASLDELRLSFTPAQWLRVELGKTTLPAGKALLLSPNDLYAGRSLDAILRGDLEPAAGTQILVAGTVFLGPGTFTLVGVPVPAVPQLFEPGSIWIPRFPVDEVIDDPRISSEPVTLGEIYAEPTRVTLEHYQRVSGGAHVGMYLGPVDLSLLYYHGVDRSPVPRVRIDFPQAPVDTYDLYLAPEEAIVDSFGIVAEAVAGSSTFWIDAAYVPNKTVTTTTIDPYSKRSRLLTAPALTAVAGASYAARSLDLYLTGEYYFGHTFLPDGVAAEDTVVSPLSNDVFVSISMRAGARSRVGISLAGIASFDDSSGVVSLSVAYEPSPAFTAAIRAPLFLGPPDSDFGQYHDILHIVSEIRYRY